MDRASASYPAVLAALAMAAAATALGCAPSIGDRCNINTDCSIQGNRLCDTAQPAGYCTIGHCTAGSCPDNATCVQFGASLPGCPYDDYTAPERGGKSLCMKTCSKDSDCRQGDGYACVAPSELLGAVILESNHSARVCMVPATPVALTDADVCSATRPDVPPIEASVQLVPDASSDAAGDGAGPAADVGAPDSMAGEAGDDGAPTGVDATADASAEDQAAPLDATLDAGTADASPDAAD